MLLKQTKFTFKQINRVMYITIRDIIKTLTHSFLYLYKHYLGNMKVLTMLGLAGILIHQIFFQTNINSSLFLELIILICFYYFGSKLLKEYNRKRMIRNRYKGYIKSHYSESSSRPYTASRRNYEIQDSSKNNY
jgi:hypothetical protein